MHLKPGGSSNRTYHAADTLLLKFLSTLELEDLLAHISVLYDKKYGSCRFSTSLNLWKANLTITPHCKFRGKNQLSVSKSNITKTILNLTMLQIL